MKKFELFYCLNEFYATPFIFQSASTKSTMLFQSGNGSL